MALAQTAVLFCEKILAKYTLHTHKYTFAHLSRHLIQNENPWKMHHRFIHTELPIV